MSEFLGSPLTQLLIYFNSKEFFLAVIAFQCKDDVVDFQCKDDVVDSLFGNLLWDGFPLTKPHILRQTKLLIYTIQVYNAVQYHQYHNEQEKIYKCNGTYLIDFNKLLYKLACKKINSMSLSYHY